MNIKEENMLMQVWVDDWTFEDREHVKDHYGFWITKEMYVISRQDLRQGYVTEVIDENNGLGKIKVQIVWQEGDCLTEDSSYVTEFEPSTNWCKALVDG